MKKVKKLNELKVLKKLFNAVTEEDILKQVGNKLYIGDKLVPEADQNQMILDANYLKTSVLWEVLFKNMQFEANKIIYHSSKNEDDMIFGKAILFAIDILRKKINTLSGIPVKQEVKQ